MTEERKDPSTHRGKGREKREKPKMFLVHRNFCDVMDRTMSQKLLPIHQTYLSFHPICVTSSIQTIPSPECGSSSAIQFGCHLTFGTFRSLFLSQNAFLSFSPSLCFRPHRRFLSLSSSFPLLSTSLSLSLSVHDFWYSLSSHTHTLTLSLSLQWQT